MFSDIEKQIIDLLISLTDKSSLTNNFFIDFNGILSKPLSSPLNMVLVYPGENAAIFAIKKNLDKQIKIEEAFTEIRKKVLIFLNLIEYLGENKYIYCLKHEHTDNEWKTYGDEYIGLQALDGDIQKKLYELRHSTFVALPKLIDLKRHHYLTYEERMERFEKIRSWGLFFISIASLIISFKN